MAFMKSAILVCVTAVLTVYLPQLWTKTRPIITAGTVQPGFEPVAKLFRENFENGVENPTGCSAFSVYYKGSKVVDIWGGYADSEAGRSWKEDTLTVVFSATKETEKKMILCCSHQCPHVWYHLSCVGLDEPPADDWYCSKKCDEDGSYIYCMCHRRKGGEMVQCAMKQDCRRHEWYHRSCSSESNFPGVSGFLPERLRHDMTWNRVANVHGMEGENIGLDLLNEFLNNEFKDMLLRSRGKYTQQQRADWVIFPARIPPRKPPTKMCWIL